MLADALQDVDEVGVRIDVVKSAGGDQALHDADLFGAKFGPAKQPVFSAHRYDAQRALQMIGVDGNLGVGGFRIAEMTRKLRSV